MAVFATDTGSIDDGRNVASYSQYDDGSGTVLGNFAPNPAGLYGMTDHGDVIDANQNASYGFHCVSQD